MTIASQSTQLFNPHAAFIYLLNNTIYTKFDKVINDVPPSIPIFVNEALERRYESVLRTRNVKRLNSQNKFSFRPLLRTLQQGKSVFVYLDVDQAGFQAMGAIAFRTGIDIVPLYVRDDRVSKGELMSIKEKNEILPSIQSYLLDSYLEKPVNLFNQLLDAAEYFGLETVICKDISAQVTYKQLLLNTYVLSQRLAKPFKPGERHIAIFLPNSIGLTVTLFALFNIHKTPVILNYSAGLQTILDACETAEVTTVLTSREFIDKGQLEQVEQGLKKRYRLIYMEDLRQSISLVDKMKGLWHFRRRKRAPVDKNEVILFTSGSEYRPRGIVLSHDNINADIQQTRSIIDFGVQDRMLNAMPMFHSFGLTVGSILPFLCGVQTYLYPSPLHYKRIPELAREEGTTILFGTSSFLEKYGQFAEPEDFRTLRYAVVGAERLKPEVERFWLQKFNLQIMQGYGATETAPIMCLDTPLNHKQGSVGRFLPGISHRLEPVPGIEKGGKLFVQGPNLMVGYLQNGQGFVKQDGWYDTGDIVDVDEQGFVTIIGRLKRFAKMAGEMVSLNLVEQIASKCYGSTDFAAINVPDERRGERIILATTVPDLTLAPFQEMVAKAGYSRLYIPSEIRYIPEFPLLGSGKTDYVTLKQQVE